MTAEHPHGDVARALWAATAEGDAETLRRLFAEDVRWRAMGLNPLSGEYHGPDGVLDYLAGVGEAVDALSSSLDSVFVGPQGAVIRYHVSATRGSKALEMDFLLLLEIVDGLIMAGFVIPVDQRENDDFWN